MGRCGPLKLDGKLEIPCKESKWEKFGLRFVVIATASIYHSVRTEWQEFRIFISVQIPTGQNWSI